jgi:hypothetical protein
MEMNFPHLETAFNAAPVRRDFRAFLSSAISRQGNSYTARMMVIASRHNRGESQNDADMLGKRIHYFAGRSGPFVNETAPHGAFLKTNELGNGEKDNYDQPVYQDASMIGKDRVVEISLSEIQAACVGQEN